MTEYLITPSPELSHSSSERIRGGVIFLGVLCTFVASAGILAGNVPVAFALLGCITLVSVTFYRLDIGFTVFLGMVLLFDNFEIPGFSSVTYSAGYFWPLNLLIPGLGIGIMNPMELHSALLVVVWIILVTLRKKSAQRVYPGIPLLLFALVLFGSLVYGARTGGDAQLGLWEIRALGYFCIMLVLVPQVIETRAHVENALLAVILAISVKAVQGFGRFISQGFNFGGYRTLTNHEDPVFSVTLFILLLGFIVFKSRHSHRTLLLWLAPLHLIGLYVANRRAAYVALGVSVFAYLVMMPQERRRRVVRVLTIAGIAFGIYLAAYWNSGGRIAQVAQIVRSTIFADDPELASSYRDYSSSLARKQEDYNTAVTFRKAPLFGIGFGKEFEQGITSWGGYSLKGYTCHNQIFWILGKTGAVGFFVFFLLLIPVVIRGSMTFRLLRDPYLKAVAAMATIAVIGQVVVSYADMQLTFYRNMVYLGFLIGLIPILPRIDANEMTRVSKD